MDTKYSGGPQNWSCGGNELEKKMLPRMLGSGRVSG